MDALSSVLGDSANSSKTLLQTFSGAFQGSISVLLTLLAGYIMARRGYLDHQTVRNVTKLCTTLFLPCLIVEEMGPELTVGKLSTVWIIPLWGLVSTLFAHAIGYLGKRVMKLPYWTVVACGRPNSNALPLLLLQSLEHTGVLDTLSRSGESVSETLNRAKSLILLNAIVQQTFTFQLAPSIMARDDGHKHDDDDDPESQDRLRPGPGRLTSVVQDSERVGLLHDHEYDGSDNSEETRAGESVYARAIGDIADQPNIHWPRHIKFLEKPIKKACNSISPVLLGAIVALIFGVSATSLHDTNLTERRRVDLPTSPPGYSERRRGIIQQYHTKHSQPWRTLVCHPSVDTAVGDETDSNPTQCCTSDVYSWRRTCHCTLLAPWSTCHIMGSLRPLHRHARGCPSLRLGNGGAWLLCGRQACVVSVTFHSDMCNTGHSPTHHLGSCSF